MVLFSVFYFVTLTTATMLYNGLQSQILTPNISTVCDEAFNTSLNCPENVVQFITYPMQSIGEIRMKWKYCEINDCRLEYFNTPEPLYIRLRIFVR